MIDVQIDDTWNVVLPEYETGEKFIPYVNRHGERHHDANNIESAAAREIIELRSSAQSLADALEAMIVEWVDYSCINNLGDAEEKHNIKQARAALKKYRGE